MNHIPDHIERQLTQWKAQNAFRTLITKPGLIDFVSNDYLGFARETQSEGIDGQSLPAGSGGSRLLSGNQQIHTQLEDRGALQFRGESALLYNSGYLANIGVLSTLPSRHDTLHYDAAVHASMKDGMRLSFAKKVSFAHNDLSALEQNLKKGTGNQFVVVESLYSMDGDFAPLTELVELCEKYKTYLVVDEAHATGLLGPEGAGYAAELGLASKVWLRIFTFGKAVGRQGAMVVGPAAIRDYLINRSRAFIYTTAMAPLMAEQLLQGLKAVASPAAKVRRNTLRERRLQLENEVGIKPTGNTVGGFSPIFPWIVPGNEPVKELAHSLTELGMDVRPILAPTIPVGQERLRIVLHTYNTTEEVSRLAKELKKTL